MNVQIQNRLTVSRPREHAGQAARQSPFSNQPLERENIFNKPETGWKPVLLWLVLLLAQPADAQNYSVDWHKIAGGGGTSTGGVYAVSGTIGQPDANAQPMTGGGYSLTGGFWSLISVAQTAGLPNLVITHSGTTVTVSWPDTGRYTLQQNSNLAHPAGWTTIGYTVTTANGTNSITITPPMGNLFFRLQSQ